MKWFKLFVLAGFVSFFPPLYAQEDNSETNEVVELKQLGIINEDGSVTPIDVKNDDRLKIQDHNGGIYEQTGNQVFIEQHGNDNSSQWIQKGENNYFKLKQEGNNNIHKGNFSGEDNLIQVLQEGNNNVLTQELVGDRMDLDVSQFGNEHELIHIEKSGTSPAYQIHQQGEHGMKVKIEHERY